MSRQRPQNCGKYGDIGANNVKTFINNFQDNFSLFLNEFKEESCQKVVSTVVEDGDQRSKSESVSQLEHSEPCTLPDLSGLSGMNIFEMETEAMKQCLLEYKKSDVDNGLLDLIEQNVQPTVPTCTDSDLATFPQDLITDDSSSVVINRSISATTDSVSAVGLVAAAKQPIFLAVPLVNMDKSTDTQSTVLLSSDNVLLKSFANSAQVQSALVVMATGNLESFQSGAVNVTTTDDISDLPDKMITAFQCSECSLSFDKSSKLKLHMISKHVHNRPHKCPFPGCQWAFASVVKMHRHLDTHESRRDYTCEVDGCGRKFSTIYNLKIHLRLHERPATIACPVAGCDDLFQTQRHLEQHLRIHDNPEKTVNCPHDGCQLKFLTVNALASHLKAHQHKRNFVCHYEGCGKIFDKQCRLNQHIRVHTGDRPFVCPYAECAWTFTTASKLNRHVVRHTGERRWSCCEPGCGKTFVRAEHLRNHAVSHTTLKPFACTRPGCGATFSARSALTTHMKRHDQRRSEAASYVCPLLGCEQTFTAKSALKQHIEQHYASSTDAKASVPWLSIFQQQQQQLPNVIEILPYSSSSSVLLPAASQSQGQSLLKVTWAAQGQQQAMTSFTSTKTPSASYNSAPPRVLIMDEDSLGGPIRHGVHGNRLLSEPVTRQAVTGGASGDGKVTLHYGPLEGVSSGVSAPGDRTMLSPSCDMLAGHGLSFRDTDSNTALYLHTPLIPDDGGAEFGGEEAGLLSEDGCELETELASMLQAGDIIDPLDDSVCADFDVTSEGHPPPPSHVFTGSTINFHDLEQDV